MTDQEAIDKARERVQGSIRRLHEMVAKACPGPHQAVQHRDMKGPWCPRCGRANDGTLLKDVNA